MPCCPPGPARGPAEVQLDVAGNTDPQIRLGLERSLCREPAVIEEGHEAV
jgi:hypothetical protein